MRDTFAGTLSEIAERDHRVMFLTADLGFGVFEKFKSRFPSQYLNVGVAEQNMIAVATGLALEGHVVFAYSIGNFPVLRCLEQIRNDAAYHAANVNIVSIGGGFSYGPLGMSHHATEDIAIMRAIPGVSSFTPGTLDDVRHSVKTMVNLLGTSYLRLDKSCGDETPDAGAFEVGTWRVMMSGTDVALVACGGVLREAQFAAEMLGSFGVSARVVNATQIAPIESETIRSVVAGVPLVVSVEEHVSAGGLGGLIAEALSEVGSSTRVLRRGIGREFVSVVGSQDYLRQQTGLDARSLSSAVVEALSSYGLP